MSSSNPSRTFAAIMLAFLLGMIGTTLQSGCQKPEPELPVSDDLMPIQIDTGTVDAPQGGSPPANQTSDGSGAPSAEKGQESKASQEPAKSSPDSEPTQTNQEPAKTGSEPAKTSDSSEAKSGAQANQDTKADGAAAADSAQGSAASSGSPALGTRVLVPAIDKNANPKLSAGDWAQWGGSTYRNNVPVADKVATSWAIGDFDRKTGEWLPGNAKNIKWVAALGSQSYGNPVVAGGRVFVGTNNSAGYLKRYPAEVDLGCLISFRESDGEFLWQHSSEKLPTGRVHDWPYMGICCAPLVEGNRLWFVTSRGEVRCLDTEGFRDGEDDGPVVNELAKLFELVKAEDPAADQVAAIVQQLDQGKIPEGLTSRLKGVDESLAENSKIKVDAAGKKWTIEGSIRGANRTISITLQGPRLTVSKVMTPADLTEADVVWQYDMMKELTVSQHNMCSCSVTAWGDILYVCTSNGVDESHINIPSPNAASFIAMNKHTGEVYWTDSSPGINIHHGQWSSPTVAMMGGELQVLFGGGDGWLYSFKANTGKDKKPELLWKFDCNPKDAKLILGGRGTRNDIIGTPVVYDGLVYVAVGQDPEHGEGEGHMWCIDPTRRGDVSPTLAVAIADRSKSIPHRREQAVIPEKGEVAIDNPNSAVVWHYAEVDKNGDGAIDFEEKMHRTCGTVAIKDELLFVADFSGLFHCLDAKTGKVHWTHDMLAAAWGSPLIANGHVYIGDEDGDLCIFKLTSEAHEPEVITMGNAVYSTPIVANNTLFIANKTHLFAIQAGDE